MSKWDYLPNAKHINDVFASLKAHPKEWDEAYDVGDAAQCAAFLSAYDAAEGEMDAIADVAMRAAFSDATPVAGATTASLGAILALIVFDDSAKYLGVSSNDLRNWAAISYNLPATLLLPAVIAYEKIKALPTA